MKKFLIFFLQKKRKDNKITAVNIVQYRVTNWASQYCQYKYTLAFGCLVDPIA